MPNIKDFEDMMRRGGKHLKQGGDTTLDMVEQKLRALAEMSKNQSPAAQLPMPNQIPGSMGQTDINSMGTRPAKTPQELAISQEQQQLPGMNSNEYDQDLSNRLKNIGNLETMRQQERDNFNPDEYTKYAMGGEIAPHDENLGRPKFNHIKEMMKKHKKAGSELEASRNPMKFIQDSKNMSIKNKRGIAF